jgi:hypothetical protein
LADVLGILSVIENFVDCSGEEASNHGAELIKT